MTKKLVSFDDQAVGSGLPAAVKAELNNTYAKRGHYVTDESRGFIRFRADDFVADHAPAPQDTPTYDGSGQSVHPDVLYFPQGWNGYRYWMAMTPYPDGNDSVENPSILVSDDGDNWIVPPGLTNPIAKPASGFWPDPDLVMDGQRMYCMWAAGWVSWSDDGTTWSEPVQNIAAIQMLSPSLVREGDTFRAWGVRRLPDGRTELLHRSGPSLHSAVGWSDAQVLDIQDPPDRQIWHIDVQRIADLYLASAVYSLAGTSGAQTIMYLATSIDGINWERSTDPVLGRRPGQWDDTNIYRATLVPSTGVGGIVADMWYSARSLSGKWRIGRTEVRLRDTSQAKNLSPNPTFTRSTVDPPLPDGVYWTITAATGRGYNVGREAFEFTIESPAATQQTVEFRTGLPAVSAGQRWSWSLDVATSAPVKMSARIAWFDATGAGISSNTTTITTRPDGEFTRLSVSAVAPTGAASMRVIVMLPAGEQAATYWLRRTQVEQGLPSPWTLTPGLHTATVTGRRPLEVLGPLTAAGQKRLVSVHGDGAWQLAGFLTASRPAASSANRGSVIFDYNLNVPLFSDGSVWRKFDGAAV